jgi:hypothetical protein
MRPWSNATVIPGVTMPRRPRRPVKRRSRCHVSWARSACATARSGGRDRMWRPDSPRPTVTRRGAVPRWCCRSAGTHPPPRRPVGGCPRDAVHVPVSLTAAARAEPAPRDEPSGTATTEVSLSVGALVAVPRPGRLPIASPSPACRHRRTRSRTSRVDRRRRAALGRHCCRAGRPVGSMSPPVDRHTATGAPGIASKTVTSGPDATTATSASGRGNAGPANAVTSTGPVRHAVRGRARSLCWPSDRGTSSTRDHVVPSGEVHSPSRPRRARHRRSGPVHLG